MTDFPWEGEKRFGEFSVFLRMETLLEPICLKRPSFIYLPSPKVGVKSIKGETINNK